MSAALPEPANPLYPLANPRGVTLNCELCTKPAYVICTACRVTYYCGVEHQLADWVGIHEKICQHLIPLRKPTPFLTTEDERRKRQNEIKDKQLEIINIARTTGQTMLFRGRYEEALPAALQSIRFCIANFGMISVQLVPSYLILAEACIGLKRLDQAEEYLCQAQWTVLKALQCSGDIKSMLHRVMGLLFVAKKDWNQCLEHLAHDVYYATKEFGAEDIRTSGAYFIMANAYRFQDRMDLADDLYYRVSCIWYRHLKGIIKSRLRPLEDVDDKMGEIVAEIVFEEVQTLTDAQEAEAIKTLHVIHDVRSRQINILSEILMRNLLALTMLHFLLQNPIKGKEFLVMVQEEMVHCPDNKLNKDALWLMDRMEDIVV